MITLAPYDKEQWLSREATFRQLLTYHKCTTQELCVALGVHCGKHVVAVRPACDPFWPKEYVAAIRHYREQYDNGLVEVAQGRTQHYFFLYAFKRKKVRKIKDVKYFRQSE